MEKIILAVVLALALSPAAFASNDGYAPNPGGVEAGNAIGTGSGTGNAQRDIVFDKATDAFNKLSFGRGVLPTASACPNAPFDASGNCAVLEIPEKEDTPNLLGTTGQEQSVENQGALNNDSGPLPPTGGENSTGEGNPGNGGGPVDNPGQGNGPGEHGQSGEEHGGGPSDDHTNHSGGGDGSNPGGHGNPGGSDNPHGNN